MASGVDGVAEERSGDAGRRSSRGIDFVDAYVEEKMVCNNAIDEGSEELEREEGTAMRVGRRGRMYMNRSEGHGRLFKRLRGRGQRVAPLEESEEGRTEMSQLPRGGMNLHLLPASQVKRQQQLERQHKRKRRTS